MAWAIPMVRLRWLVREVPRDDGTSEAVRVLQYAVEHKFPDGFFTVCQLEWCDVPEVKEP